MPSKPTVLVTGVSGNLGVRLLPQLSEFQVIGADVRPPSTTEQMFRFEQVDLGEERSCNQLLELMGAYRPEAVLHLAFIVDPLRSGVLSRRQMWQVNVAGTSRVTEAIAEHNRMVGGIDKFVFPSSALVYGPEMEKAVSEESPLNAQSLAYALQQQEADITVQQRARGLRKCKTYLLRPHVYAGASVQNYQLGVLRGVPGGKGRLAERMRRRGSRLPLWLPSRGNYLDHRFQFVHVDDMARLIAHILQRKQGDPRLTVLNVAGRGEPLSLRRCIEIAKIEVKRVPTRAICRQRLRLLWDLGVTDIPAEALPYMLGSSAMDTARLRVFLGEHYRSVIQYTCEEALADSFGREQQQEASAGHR
ncbi:MAG TPA: NAD-dependent epimerase/dehydratase family protein [Candidatus Limnocylindrales bacterium]|nr:NAD-dependent epimerase/dehydratase family protein [Candidatus Limnocylindrales bacterium]